MGKYGEGSIKERDKKERSSERKNSKGVKILSYKTQRVHTCEE